MKDQDVNFICSPNVSSCLSLIVNLGSQDQQQELDRLFNTLVYVGEQDKINWQIQTKLDPLQRGYVEMDDLVNLIQE